VANLGLRFSAPFLRLFVLGNYGYGLSGKFTSSTGTDDKLKSHTFYGGTVTGLVSVTPFVKLGPSLTYEMHSTKLEDSNGYTSPAYKSKVMSANLVLDISL
jgi:hypothetical protein